MYRFSLASRAIRPAILHVSNVAQPDNVPLSDYNLHALDPSQLHILCMVSLTLGSVSLLSTIWTCCCFFRMRRSFRHDLIMLLILSDMLKSVWLIIFPIVGLTRGIVHSDSTFCQVSGFFLSLGIEACDVAVVLVAIHTALYIFRRGNGLHAHRHVAYGALFIIPVVLASLPFIHTPAFVNSGEYCYIPIRPRWSRRALSWIPRYFIIATILIIYASIYTYVAILTKRFDGLESETAASPSPVSADDWPQAQLESAVPPTPPIAHHGLLSLSHHGSRQFRKNEQLHTPEATARGFRDDMWSGIFELESYTINPDHSVEWDRPRFSPDSTPTRHSRQNSDTSFIDPLNINSRQIIPQQELLHIPVNEVALQPSGSAAPPKRSDMVAATRNIRHFLMRPTALLKLRVPTPAKIFKRFCHSSRSSTASSNSVLFSPRDLNATNMAKAREKIRRQLCQLFIYPFVYVLIWIMPFVSHVMGGDGNEARFGIILASLISLCVQGTVNCLLFSIQERPWRFANGSTSSRKCFWCCRRSINGAANVGRTREEMRIDETVARRRRDQELVERRLGQSDPDRALRDWWDCLLEMDNADADVL